MAGEATGLGPANAAATTSAGVRVTEWKESDYYVSEAFFHDCGLPDWGVLPSVIPSTVLTKDMVEVIFDGHDPRNGYKLAALNVKAIPLEDVLHLASVVDGHDAPVNNNISLNFARGLYYERIMKTKVNWARFARCKLVKQLNTHKIANKPAPIGPPHIRDPTLRYIPPPDLELKDGPKVFPRPIKATSLLLRAAVAAKMKEQPALAGVEKGGAVGSRASSSGLSSGPAPSAHNSSTGKPDFEFDIDSILANTPRPASKSGSAEPKNWSLEARLSPLVKALRTYEDQIASSRALAVKKEDALAIVLEREDSLTRGVGRCEDEVKVARDSMTVLADEMATAVDKRNALMTQLEELQAVFDDEQNPEEVTAIGLVDQALEAMDDEFIALEERGLAVEKQTRDGEAELMKMREDLAIAEEVRKGLEADGRGLDLEVANLSLLVKAQKLELEALRKQLDASPPMMSPQYIPTATSLGRTVFTLSKCPCCSFGYHCNNFWPASCGHSYHPDCLAALLDQTVDCPACVACGEPFHPDWLKAWGVFHNSSAMEKLIVDWGVEEKRSAMEKDIAQLYSVGSHTLQQRRDELIASFQKQKHTTLYGKVKQSTGSSVADRVASMALKLKAEEPVASEGTKATEGVLDDENESGDEVEELGFKIVSKVGRGRGRPRKPPTCKTTAIESPKVGHKRKINPPVKLEPGVTPKKSQGKRGGKAKPDTVEADSPISESENTFKKLTDVKTPSFLKDGADGQGSSRSSPPSTRSHQKAEGTSKRKLSLGSSSSSKANKST